MKNQDKEFAAFAAAIAALRARLDRLSKPTPPTPDPAPPKPVPVEPVDDLPFLETPPPAEPTPWVEPSPPVEEKPMAPMAPTPMAPALTTPQGVGNREGDQSPPKKIPQKQERASEGYADQIMAALPMGTLLRKSNGKPVTTTLAAGDLAVYTKAKTTQKKVLDILAKRKVITQRPGQAALVNEAYRYQPDGGVGKVEPDPLKAETIAALTNGKPLKFSAAEAEKMYQHSEGVTPDERIKTALKSKGNEVR